MVLVRSNTAGVGICAGFVGFGGTRGTPHTLKIELESCVMSTYVGSSWRSV